MMVSVRQVITLAGLTLLVGSAMAASPAPGTDGSPVAPQQAESDTGSRDQAEAAARELHLSRIEAAGSQREAEDPDRKKIEEAAKEQAARTAEPVEKQPEPDAATAAPEAEKKPVKPRVSRIEAPRPNFSF